MSSVRVTFHATYPPYVSGDVAGLAPALAALLRARGIVSYDDPEPEVDLDALDRAGLIALAGERLGLAGAPPDDTSDEDLRDALRGALAGGTPPAAPAAPSDFGWDRLDVMDRVHLEAFARAKCGMAGIDAGLTDAELRGQIRAVAAASLSAGATAQQAEPAAPKRRPRA